jgi:hypothetical protein
MEVEAVDLELLKAELSQRKAEQAVRDREMQEILESKLDSSKEDDRQTKALEPNIPITLGTVETEAPAEGGSDATSEWCCGKVLPCELM